MGWSGWDSPVRVLGNSRRLWRTKWMARVEDKNWLHGLVAFNILVLSLPHSRACLEKCPMCSFHLKLLELHSKSELIPPPLFSNALHTFTPLPYHDYWERQTALSFNIKCGLPRTGTSTKFNLSDPSQFCRCLEYFCFESTVVFYFLFLSVLFFFFFLWLFCLVIFFF